MKAAFKLMMFSILLNAAVGLMITSVPAFEIPEYRGGMYYNESINDEFTFEMNSSVNPTGDVEDADSAIDRLLDKLNLGIISKFLNLLDQYMYGFVNIITPVLGLTKNIENFLKGLITFAYVMGAIWLWTGKDLGKG